MNYKNRFPEVAVSKISWDCLENSMKKKAKVLRDLYVNGQQDIVVQGITQPNEDINHILLCQSTQTCINWETSFMTYLQTLIKAETSTNVLMTIKIKVNRMRGKKATLSIHSFKPKIRESIKSQRIVG